MGNYSKPFGKDHPQNGAGVWKSCQESLQAIGITCALIWDADNTESFPSVYGLVLISEVAEQILLKAQSQLFNERLIEVHFTIDAFIHKMGLTCQKTICPLYNHTLKKHHFCNTWITRQAIASQTTSVSARQGPLQIWTFRTTGWRTYQIGTSSNQKKF